MMAVYALPASQSIVTLCRARMPTLGARPLRDAPSAGRASLLISAHQARIPRHVSGEDGGEAADRGHGSPGGKVRLTKCSLKPAAALASRWLDGLSSGSTSPHQAGCIPPSPPPSPPPCPGLIPLLSDESGVYRAPAWAVVPGAPGERQDDQKSGAG